MKSSALQLLVFFLCVGVCYCEDQPEIRKESDAHEFFLLRDSVPMHSGVSDFYAGEVSCAFNEIAKCENAFGKVLAAAPKSRAAQHVHRILTAVALRQGQYRRALLEIDALLAIHPSDGDAKQSRPLIEGLSQFPDQQVSGDGRATVQMDNGKLPILINSRKASYSFDTGANLSVMSESDAAQFGMDIYDIKSNDIFTDINGSKVSFRIALARSLSVGGITVRNVAFLIAANGQQPFVDMKPGERGLIGLPVLEALGSIRWTRTGIFEADRTAVPVNVSTANMCFDDLNLLTQAGFEHHTLPFFLDTGASTSELWPKFAKVAHRLVRKSGTRGVHTVTGMGGGKKLKIVSVPKVVLQLGGDSVTFEPARILMNPQSPASKWFYGSVGIDLLRQAQSVTIDFRKMMLGLSTQTDRDGMIHP